MISLILLKPNSLKTLLKSLCDVFICYGLTKDDINITTGLDTSEIILEQSTKKNQNTPFLIL